MNKKILTLMLALTLLFGSKCFGLGREYYSVTFVDEWGDPRTDITQVDVETTAGVDVAVYTTQFGTTEVGSTGVITTGISDGSIEFWYEETSLDLGVTDGTHTLEIETFTNVTYRYWFPNHLNEFSGTDYGQTDDCDFSYANFIIDGDTTNRLDIIPDNDGGIVAFGDASTQVDLYIYSGGTSKYFFFDEGSEEVFLLDIDIQWDDAAKAIFGTNDDFAVYSDTANIIEFDPALQGNEIRFGTSETDSVVMTWYGDGGAGDTVVFDEENNMVEFEDIAIALGDDTKILFGDTIGTGDFSLYSSSDVLYLRQVAADTGTMEIGVAGTDIPFIWHAETSGAEVTATGDLWTFDGVDIVINDGDIFTFGDDTDVTIAYDNSNGDLDVTSTSALDEISFGATGDGYDIIWHSTTAGDTVLFDYSADAVLLEDIELFLGDDEGLYFGDAVGTGDIKVMYSSAILAWTQVVADTGSITYGANGTDIPTTWYAETTSGDVIFTGDTWKYDGVDVTFEDDDLLNFGDSAEVSMNYDEDGNDDLQIKGPVSFETTLCKFDSIPVYCSLGSNATPVWGGVATGTAGDENVMMFPEATFVYHILGDNTAELGPQHVTKGALETSAFDISFEDAADEGVEIVEGDHNVGGTKTNFTIGTDAFYLKVKIYLTDADGSDDLFIGFRKLEAFEAAVNDYDSYAMIGVQVADFYTETEGNDGTISLVSTDLTTTNWANTEAHELGIYIDAAKAVTYTIDGSAAGGAAAFTWTDTDVVVPFLFFLHHTEVSELTYLQSWECGLQ